MKAIRIIKSVRRMLFLSTLRVVLSLTGIAVGITSVIIMVSIGEGARNKMLSEIEAMGSNVITVDAGIVKELTGKRRQTSKVTTLTEKDARAIAEECTSVNAVAPTQERELLVKYENSVTSTRIIGTTSAFPSIRNYSVASGRFFNQDDNTLSLRAAVIGQKTVNYLFGNGSPVGEFIKINNIPFEIIGVLKSKGSSYDGSNEDDVIFIPLTTGMRRVFNVDYIRNIYARVNSKDEMSTAEKEIRTLLREKHRLHVRNKEDDFTIQNVYTVVQAEQETSKSFTALIASVVALSLLVGEIGILATMLLSVKQRNPEIGLRIAVGATRNDILFQFLLEAVVLSMLGGAVGIFAGVIGAYLIGLFTDVAARISLQPIMISFFISVAIGIFFGAYPARRASFIEPVRALKV